MSKLVDKKLTHLDYLGEGAYGKVYKALMDSKEVAVKRNLVENTCDFLGNFRELNFLSTIKHPNVLGIMGYIYGDPFDEKMTPIKKKLKLKDDQIHFIMEKADCDIDDLCGKESRKNLIDKYGLNWNHFKEIFFQSLLGLEYLHKNGIIHRDVKLGNLLLYIEPPNGKGIRENWIDPKSIVRGKGRPRSADASEVSESVVDISEKENLLMIKLCDFGFTKRVSNQGRMTPNTYTLSIRPPEIYLDLEYNTSADIWAMGVSFFEILTGDRLFAESPNPKIVIMELMEKLPYTIDFRGQRAYSEILKRKGITRSKKFKDVNTWESLVGKPDIAGLADLDVFLDLLEKMLQFFPEKRLTACECLNHRFFDSFRDRLEKIRGEYPVYMNLGDLPLNHKKCEQRVWMENVITKMYDFKNTNKKNVIQKWWKPEIIFHAVDLYDRYLNLTHENWTKEETYLRVLCCIYIFVKYFSTMDFIITFNVIAFEPYCDRREESLAIEKDIVEKTGGRIFYDTVYEYTEKLTDTQVEKLMLFIISSESNGMTRQEIWKKVL